MPAIPWRPADTGVELAVRVTPNAARNAVEGVQTRAYGPALRLRVTAPPDRGRANKAVLALLAKALPVPKSAITIVAGETARDKLLNIAGDPARLDAALRALAAPPALRPSAVTR